MSGGVAAVALGGTLPCQVTVRFVGVVEGERGRTRPGRQTLLLNPMHSPWQEILAGMGLYPAILSIHTMDYISWDSLLSRNT